MAITTLDGVIAGAKPPVYFAKNQTGGGGAYPSKLPISYWGSPGIPGAGTFNTSLNGGTYSNTSAYVAGSLYHVDPGGGVNAYLSRLSLYQAVAAGSSLPAGGGFAFLFDRIWDNGGITITSTSAQTITSPTWPARDLNGATAGAGVMLAVEVSAETGSGTPSFTVGYTNSGGTTGRSATGGGSAIDSTTSNEAAGTFHRLALQAGDIGVQSVQSITLSATWTSGTINLVAYRFLAMVDLPYAPSPKAIDCVRGGFPRLYNGVVPFIVVVPCVANATALITGLSGTYTETWG